MPRSPRNRSRNEPALSLLYSALPLRWCCSSCVSLSVPARGLSGARSRSREERAGGRLEDNEATGGQAARRGQRPADARGGAYTRGDVPTESRCVWSTGWCWCCSGLTVSSVGSVRVGTIDLLFRVWAGLHAPQQREHAQKQQQAGSGGGTRKPRMEERAPAGSRCR
jgi:hypothetical protein